MAFSAKGGGIRRASAKIGESRNVRSFASQKPHVDEKKASTLGRSLQTWRAEIPNAQDLDVGGKEKRKRESRSTRRNERVQREESALRSYPLGAEGESYFRNLGVKKCAAQLRGGLTGGNALARAARVGVHECEGALWKRILRAPGTETNHHQRGGH